MLRLIAATAAFLCACMIPIVARRANLPNTAACLGGAAFAIVPLNLVLETTGTHEQPLDGLMLMIVLAVALELKRDPSTTRWGPWSAGMLVGLAALLHPQVALAGATMICLCMLRTETGGRPTFHRLGLAALGCALVVAPWISRNKRVFGRFIPIRSNLGLELRVANHDAAEGSTYGIVEEE